MDTHPRGSQTSPRQQLEAPDMGKNIKSMMLGGLWGKELTGNEDVSFYKHFIHFSVQRERCA